MSVTHRCRVPGCRETIPLDMLMCRAHWRLVPKDRQRAVWRTWRARQRAQAPSVIEAAARAHDEAAQRAVEAVLAVGAR